MNEWRDKQQKSQEAAERMKIGRHFFGSSSLEAVLTSKARHIGMAGASRSRREDLCSAVLSAVYSGGLDTSSLVVRRVGSKRQFLSRDPVLQLALHASASAVRQQSGPVGVDRNELVKTLKDLLSEGRSVSLIRLDISNFFESINTTELLQLVEKRLSFDELTLGVVRSVLGHCKRVGVHGVPRGLAISPILAELYMEEFDREVRSLPGTYFYGRYVDDLIVLFSGDPARQEGHIRRALRHRALSISAKPAKYAKFRIDDSGEWPDCTTFSFLGYEFSRVGGKVQLRLSASRFERLCKRVSLSFLRFAKDRDLELLRARLRFLTRNFPVHSKTSRHPVMSGIYYNNRCLTEEKPVQLEQLDKVIRSQVFCRGGVVGTAMRSLSRNQRRSLMGFSFVEGYVSRRGATLDEKTIAEIRRAWTYVS